MVDVDMNLIPPKVIGKKAYLQTRGSFGLSQDPRLKRHPNT
jgi:hypothetical protein